MDDYFENKKGSLGVFDGQKMGDSVGKISWEKKEANSKIQSGADEDLGHALN